MTKSCLSSSTTSFINRFFSCRFNEKLVKPEYAEKGLSYIYYKNTRDGMNES